MHYEFNRLPFGLSISQANFEWLLDVVLKNLVGEECYVFSDAIIIFSKTADYHASRLKSELERFENPTYSFTRENV